MSRELLRLLKECVMYIFFRKISVMLMNKEEFDKFLGIMVIFDVFYENNNLSSMSWLGERSL